MNVLREFDKLWSLKWDCGDACNHLQNIICQAKISYGRMKGGRCSNKTKAHTIYCGKYFSYDPNLIKSNGNYKKSKIYKHSSWISTCRRKVICSLKKYQRKEKEILYS